MFDSRHHHYIALYLPSLRYGGAERVMVNLANKFVSLRKKTDMVLGNVEGPYVDEVSDKVRIISLDSSRVRTSFLRLVRYITCNRPNVIISTMSHANIVAIGAWILSGRKDVSLVVREANTISVYTKNSKVLRERILPLLAKVLYPFASDILANSFGSALDLSSHIDIPFSRIKVIYNPIDIPRINSMSKKFPEHSWFKDSRSSVIMGMGRLTAQKDFATLLRAFKIMCQKRHNHKLVIFGDGEERTNLEKLVKKLKLEKKVDMPGFVKNPYPYLSRADLFVLSSRWEGSPNVLLEALALGVPVVSTNCPSGASEILADGKYGRLVPVGDYKALAHAIMITLDNLVKIKGSMLKRRAELFSIDKIASKYLDTISADQ